MEKYIQESEAANNYLTYGKQKVVRQPTVENKFNESYLYNGPQGLQRDYENMYKALEYRTKNFVQSKQNLKQTSTNEVQIYKDENLKYQQQFDKALNDNKVLYQRCKELELFLSENPPRFKVQSASLMAENERLRRENQSLLNNNGIPQEFQDSSLLSLGAEQYNRMQALQIEIDDLKRQNYDLKLKLQAQISDKGLPLPRAQIVPVERVLSPIIYSNPPPQQIQRPAQSYCDTMLQSNEQHNQMVLDRCKYIVSAHNYY